MLGCLQSFMLCGVSDLALECLCRGSSRCGCLRASPHHRPASLAASRRPPFVSTFLHLAATTSAVLHIVDGPLTARTPLVEHWSAGQPSANLSAAYEGYSPAAAQAAVDATAMGQRRAAAAVVLQLAARALLFPPLLQAAAAEAARHRSPAPAQQLIRLWPFRCCAQAAALQAGPANQPGAAAAAHPVALLSWRSTCLSHCRWKQQQLLASQLHSQPRLQRLPPPRQRLLPPPLLLQPQQPPRQQSRRRQRAHPSPPPPLPHSWQQRAAARCPPRRCRRWWFPSPHHPLCCQPRPPPHPLLRPPVAPPTTAAVGQCRQLMIRTV